MSISEKLLKVLEHDDAYDLRRVVTARRENDFAALLNLLSIDPSVNAKHRDRAIYILGVWGDHAAVNPILRILPHLVEQERITAIDALGRLGTKEALEGILNYVDDPSPHVRKFVTRALGRINTAEAQAKLKEIAAKDSVDYIRAIASKYIKPS